LLWNTFEEHYQVKMSFIISLGSLKLQTESSFLVFGLFATSFKWKPGTNREKNGEWDQENVSMSESIY